MEIKIEKMRSFTDLPVWQEGHKLVLMIFKSANTFPEKETAGLGNQIKKSALSLTSNIAEGFGRSSAKEKIQFYKLSLKALREIQNYLLIGRDLGYFANDIFDKVAAKTTIVNKLCNELVKDRKF